MFRKLKYIVIFFFLIFTIFNFYNSYFVVRAKASDFFYVGGKGIGNYTFIQNAINNSNEGDIIKVYNGNYTENIVINKSICLLGEDKNNVTIYGENGLYSVLIKSPNITISGFTIKKSNVGLLISGSDYNSCNITNNIFTKNYEAIRIINSSENNISKNIIKQNLHLGIVLYDSNFNFIYNNTFIENNKVVYLGRWSNCNIIFHNNLTYYNYGIHIDYSFNNQITRNLIKNGDFGIQLTSSKNNNITNNYIGNNNQIGIFTSSSDENMIYPNIFINNNQDVSKKTRPPDIKTPGFEFILVFIAIFFITLVKKNR